ncbi:MAG: hypothetical protein ACFHX7_16980 [Pseudomonadota bacterium]
MNKKRKLLYIMSPSYSGSTLLTRLLACHPDIATVGELKATSLGDISTYHCSCGELLQQCVFWQGVKSAVERAGGHMDLAQWRTQFQTGRAVVDRIMTPLVRGPVLEFVRSAGFLLVPGARHSLETILEHNARVIEAVCELQDGQVFLDESKDPLRLMYFEQSGRWDIHVISLVRDGRGTVNSDRKHNALGVSESASNWVRKIREMQRVSARFSADHRIDITYEELCDNTRDVLTRIARFVGASEEFPIDADKEQHIIGNNMRLSALDEIVLDEKWRKEMTAQDIESFERVAGSLNRGLGYRE